jgi:hypothetical protein
MCFFFVLAWEERINSFSYLLKRNNSSDVENIFKKNQSIGSEQMIYNRSS